MKSKTFTLLLVFAMAVSVLSTAYAADTRVSVYINGRQISFPDQQPFIDTNGRTLVPLRLVSEELGAEVKWIPEGQKVEIKKGTNNIVLAINSPEVLIDGVIKRIDTVPLLINSRTMVPLRFISEILGCKVDWSQAERRVDITTPDKNKKSSKLPELEGNKWIEEANIHVENENVTLEIKFKKDIPEENIAMIESKTSSTYDMWYWTYWTLNAEVDNGQYEVNIPYYQLDFDRERMILKVTGFKLLPPTSQEQVVVYTLIFKGPSKAAFITSFPPVVIQPNPDIEPVYIKEATVVPGDEPGYVHIVMKFNRDPGHYVTAPTVNIIKEVNGIKDEQFDHTNHWSRWIEEDLTFILRNVKLPEPTSIPQQVVFTIFYKDQPPVKTEPYIVPAVSCSQQDENRQLQSGKG